jgi:natural product precursor
MKKIYLKDLKEVMSNSELRNVMGGEYASVCDTGYYFDWYFMACRKSSENNPKIDACKDLPENSYCSFKTDYGNWASGRCLSLAPAYVKHCSNLI